MTLFDDKLFLTKASIKYAQVRFFPMFAKQMCKV